MSVVASDERRHADAPLTVGLINENLSGHAAFHSRLLAGLSDVGGFRLESLDVPGRGLMRRVLTNPLPLPEGWDFDAPLFRNQVGQSFAVRSGVKSLVERCDVIHIYTQNACPLTMRYLRRKPYVVTVDATCSQAAEKFPFRYTGRGSAIGDRLSSLVEARLLRNAAGVVAQSQWARAAVIEKVGLDESLVHCIRIGAPSPWPRVIRPSRRPRVVFVGARMHRKGGWELLRILAPWIGKNLDVVLVTHDSVPNRPGVEVRNDVRPGDGQIERILGDADIFALPTDMDMSPNAVLEAMAAGLPVVTYRCGALAEMVDDGASGYVVDLHDERSFGEAVMDLVDCPYRRRMFGDEGRRVLARRFDARAASSALAGVLRQAATGDAWVREGWTASASG